MRLVIRCFVGCGFCLLLCRATLADGVFLDGLSARSIGRGGTNIAHSDNGSVLHDNPAGISNIADDRLFEVGATMLFTDFQYADPQNSNTTVSQLYAMPEFTILRKSPDSDWTYGVGVYAPAGFGSRFYLEGSGAFPGTQLYKSFATLGRILPGASYKLTDKLSVGATLGVAVMVADLEGPYTLQSAPFTGLPTHIDVDAGGAALSWSTGINYIELSDETTLGLTYQSTNRFKAHGTTAVDVPGLGHTEYDTRMYMTWPQSVGGGLRHLVTQKQVLSLDLVWYDWSSAFDEIGLRLSSSSTPGFPHINEQVPLHWRDSISTRVGYEFLLENNRTLRFGYVHHRSPIPAGTMTPYIPAALEHAFSTGYGMRAFGWNLDLAYMFSFGPSVHTNNSDFVGGDFDNSTTLDRTHALALTLMRSW